MQAEKKLPNLDGMLREVTGYECWRNSRFYASGRHTIEVDGLTYEDDLATEVGCRPNLCIFLPLPFLPSRICNFTSTAVSAH